MSKNSAIGSADVSFLILGWKTNDKFEPAYWLDPNAKQGEQDDASLFRVEAKSIGAHTAVIAQSGSGKSFFMGRLIEEILLRTRARCLVFDPNADFRRVTESDDDELWTNANWNGTHPRQKRFTHEKEPAAFRNAWKDIKTRILVGHPVGKEGDHQASPEDPREQLQLWWPRIPSQLLANDLDPTDRSDLHYCHRVVNLLGDLLDLKAETHARAVDLEPEARRLFTKARKASKEMLKFYIDKSYGPDAINGISKSKKHEDETTPAPVPSVVFPKSQIDKLTAQLFDLVIGIRAYVSQRVERYYFGRFREYRSSGILQTRAQSPAKRMKRAYRLEVVDLPSIDENIRIEAVGALIKTEWKRAREAWESSLRRAAHHRKAKKDGKPDTENPKPKDERVPTFIIVDEAHNLIPDEPNGSGQEALREDFRRIVAEGRKFGLFLIFVSQRPDKLDPLIFSECENKVVMRLGSKQVIETTRKMMGLEELPDGRLENARQFGPGRALMIGKWCAKKDGEIIYAAARRTVEGGGNLDDAFWAQQPETPAPGS